MDSCFFLGANSRSGFYSLYDQLIDRHKENILYIIKGGPGCGKSSFMRRIAKRMAEAGLDLEYILCSGDPASLDALHIPALGVAFVDGTSPHVIEASCPAAMERYVNLGEFYDVSALMPRKPEILRLFAAYKPLYDEAYRHLAAAAALKQGLYAPLFSQRSRQTVLRRAKGISSREFPRQNRPGSSRSLFLDAFTCQGPMRLYDTALALCPKVFLLDNRLDLAPFMLAALHSAALESGQVCILCPDPVCPEKAAHLLLPELGLCFISQSAALPYSGPVYRHVRLDALADPNLLREQRGDLRALSGASDALLRRAESKLAKAKALHDELEALYNPHVDFDGVYALAEHIAAELLTKAL